MKFSLLTAAALLSTASGFGITVSFVLIHGRSHLSLLPPLIHCKHFVSFFLTIILSRAILIILIIVDDVVVLVSCHPWVQHCTQHGLGR